MARNFFEQIFLASDIGAMTRNFDCPAVMRLLRVEPKPFEDLLDGGICNRRSQKCLDPLPSQSCRGRLSWTRKNIDHVSINHAASESLNERRCAITRIARHLNIRAAFESIRCFAYQSKGTRRFANGK